MNCIIFFIKKKYYEFIGGTTSIGYYNAENTLQCNGNQILNIWNFLYETFHKLAWLMKSFFVMSQGYRYS